MPELEEVLGIAYLHKSEMDNDVYRTSGRPMHLPAAIEQCAMRRPRDSEKAVEYLLKYLQRSRTLSM